MKRRFVIKAVIFSTIHFVVTIATGSMGYIHKMQRLDSPDHYPSKLEHAFRSIADILMQPVISLYTPWMSQNHPNGFVWVLLLLNSLLWGTILSLILASVIPTANRQNKAEMATPRKPSD